MNVKDAVMLSVSHKDWKMPKFILIETDAKHGELIKDIAEKAFKQFEASQQLKDMRLLDYCYYGNVDVLTTQ